MRKLIVIGSLISLFLLGGVCGFALAIRLVRNTVSEDYFVAQRLAEETRRLNLSPGQLENAKPIYEQLRVDLVEAKRRTIEAVIVAASKHASELSKLLDEKQVDAFKKLNEERREKFEKKVMPWKKISSTSL